MPVRDQPQEILRRRCRVALAIHQHPRGVSSARLSTLVGESRQTVERDVWFLRARVGLAIDRVRRNGETLHKLKVPPPAAVTASPLQMMALRFAREAMGPLGGTALADHLDSFIASLPAPPVKLESVVTTVGPRIESPKIVRVLDEAVRGRKQVEISVRQPGGGRQANRSHRLDPLGLWRVGEALHLLGWSYERSCPRTFEVADIRGAQVLPEAASEHPEVREEEVFERPVRAWTGATVLAKVRLAREAAWVVGEHPLLPSQEAVLHADGTAVVSAWVEGIVEARRWVLSWGKSATVLEPAELREAVLGELRAALAGYEGLDSSRRRDEAISP